MRVLLVFLLAILSASPAAAQVYSGRVQALDGDTLEMTGERIRLFGIDAPESSQTCRRGTQEWACGKEAAASLAGAVSGKLLVCEQKDRDSYGRVVAVCEVEGADVAEMLVQQGLAVALPRFTDRYVGTEQWARGRGSGIWGGSFQQPFDYRAAHPHEFAPAQRRRARSQDERQTAMAPLDHGPSDRYFASCREAWAAGYAPMRRGSPGYRAGLDGDDDGVACEPFRRR